ncbi:MAG: NapC/NirT family cytochrome c [Gammaproteobacteria bacterium]|nr:NapC/NirT family cytochrome c [Gammaproteobacteria bacterium]
MFNLYAKMLSRKIILGTTVGVALFFMVIGVIFWGGFNTAMEVTNTLEFCISCHEMEENVYQEYNKTVHYTNRAGVRATCSDCHVPRPWVHKVVRKIQASNEVLHKVLGTIDTPEKFDNKRLHLAQNVWRTMKETDSRECRNCHDFSTMDPEKQKGRAKKQHINAMEAGNTCIDCHKGIAHNSVHDQMDEEEMEALEAPNPDFIKPMPAQWVAYLEQKNDKQPAVETAEVAPIAPAEKQATPAAATEATAPAATTSSTGGSSVNWSAVPAREVVLFYPGQSSMEWVLGRQHGGKRAFTSGDRCFDCHEEELADMGAKIAAGEKDMKVGKDKEHGMEPTVIPGKRGSFPVKVQSTHDGENLHMRFEWADAEHTPAPFVEGGKMDPDNKVKLAVMFATDEVEYADRAGCWGTCHADLRSMPFAPEQSAIDATALKDASDGVTKYLTESRTKIELKGRGGKALGGWDKLKEEGELKAELDAGRYMDLVRYKAGQKVSENGHILSERVPHDGQDVEFTASLNSGMWTVEMTRKLKSDKPGDINMDTGTVYNFGFAIHDDYTTARYHHVSIGYKLGFDNAQAEINAVKQ